MITYVNKEQIYPRFGYADPEANRAYVRNDLPKRVREFVAAHESYHLLDDAKWWVWREIKASVYAAWKYPIGFLRVCFMSLAPYRLKYYWDRITKGEH
jgi:hypothetical protein